ncbi:alpha/beta fold hydrolase [Gilvimarinus sp. F26214L]|uniref:alpha/beta fold hydrolase n=1 Tax=Gilvimarinus sp. DZF01 TaxID=3461371 RepID=UPI004045A3D8
MNETVYLTHGRINLALHTLRSGEGPRLLLLHGLGEHSPSVLPREYERWPGPIQALDFTGHGHSTVPRGGGYTAELLQADVDVALAHCGPATIVGRGLGAYVAVLIAGGRPELVRGAILRDGPGLAGGAPGSSPYIGFPEPTQITPPDPFAIVELATDVRPPDYISEFVRLAAEFSNCSRPITVCASERAPWVNAVVAEIGVEVTSVEDALNFYATLETDQ